MTEKSQNADKGKEKKRKLEFTIHTKVKLDIMWQLKFIGRGGGGFGM